MTFSFRESFLRFRAFIRPTPLDSDLDAEMASHLQFAIEENLKNGMSPRDAERQARISFGGPQQSKEKHRESRSLPFLESLLQDFRFAFRTLFKSPSFVAVVILSLALGIGANTTIFTIMNALLYRPLPYSHADRMVAIWEIPLAHPEQRQPPPIAELLDWQKQNDVFEDIALTSGNESSLLSGANGSEAIRI